MAFDGEAGRHVLIFDRSDLYDLLGENDSGGADLESTIVNSPSERP